MSKFDIDYSELESKIYKKAYKYAEVKDRLEKVAFDIVRFKEDDNLANLWQVQPGSDGDYIVALYNEEDDKIAVSWDVKVSKASGNLDFWYKKDPIVSVASSKIGIPASEINKVEKYLPEKLANNKRLVKALLQELNKTAREEVLAKYPELV